MNPGRSATTLGGVSTPESHPPITALVPARGGSKRIRRKNLVDLAGKPLILHVLDTLRQVPFLDRIVVCTEDDEIRSVVQAHGFEVRDRPLWLADDRATIDQLTDWWQRTTDEELLVVQPTVPLVSVDTIARFVAHARDNIPQTWTMAAEVSHIYWETRQLDVTVQEIGIRYYPPHRSGRPENRWIMPNREAVDIDTLSDLTHTRQQLGRRNIIFEFVAGHGVGSGHLHRTLTLAEHLQHHDIHLIYRGEEKWVHNLLDERGWDWHESEFQLPDDLEPGAWIIDTLDTEIAQVTDRLADGWKVVTLEDHGPGARHADLVINALYPPAEDLWERHPHRLLWGAQYAVLRPEFLALPEREIRDNPERLLITFGGTDPQDYTERVADLVYGLSYPNLETVSIEPPGRAHQPARISMASELLAADIVITSGGRTVYEAAACGTPTLVLTQNPREATHVHLGRWGNTHLGLGGFVSDDKIRQVVRHLLDNPYLRASMSRAGRASIDGKGARRIVRKIEDLLEGL